MSDFHDETGVANLTIASKKDIGKATRNKRRRSSNRHFDNLIPKVDVLKEKKRKNLLDPSFNIQETLKFVRFNSIRDLTLFALQVSDECPGFIKVGNRNLINSVVCLIVPGLELTDFGVDHDPILNNSLEVVPNELSFVKEHFDKFIATNSPGDRNSLYPLLKGFTSIPFTKKQKTNKIRELENKSITFLDLLMTADEYIENDYPIHPSIRNIRDDQKTPLPEGWVDTFHFEHDGPSIFAIDCEMCECESGKVLTRVSLIDFNENVLIDEYVKPDEPITNYLTQYSGITEELLENVTTTLKDVQNKILGILSSKNILIGHSIENDLNVLKLRHPSIIDTSLIFQHPRGPPFKSSLRYLANQHLDRTIQDGSHDSVEDAKTCVDLVKLKLSSNALLGQIIDSESIFKVLGDAGKTAVILDYLKVQNDQKKYVQCSSDDEITDLIIEKVKSTDLVLAKFKELEVALGWENTGENAQTAESTNDLADIKSDTLKRTNARLQKIYDSLPANTAFILCSGYSNPTQVRDLGKRKREFKREYENKEYNEVEVNWTSDDEARLRDHVKSARKGIAFLTIKAGEPVISATKLNDLQKDNEQAIIEEESTDIK